MVKNMKNARSISMLFLVGSMLLPTVLSSCNNGSKPSDTDTTETKPQLTAESDDINYSSLTLLERLQLQNESIPDDLPEKDLGGEELFIHNTRDVQVAGPDEQTGDIVDDVMYARNSEIEERFHCKLTNHVVEHADYNEYVSKMNSLFLSGDDVIDLMLVWNTTASTFSAQGFLTDLNTLPYIDFDKPWFFKNATEQLSYRGHTFVSVDLLGGYSLYQALSCVFFNKNLALEYQLENLYDIVREGRWTFDYVQTITKDMYRDMNGNGAVDITDDLFGFEVMLNQFSYETIPALELYLIGKDENDMPYLVPSVNAERFEQIYSTLKTYMTGTDAVTYSRSGEDVFHSGRALLANGNLRNLKNLRDVGFDIGILPSFKYDETQETYLSSFIPDPSAIPATCATPERSALILSAYAAGGFKKVAVPYFETVVKNKYTTDEDSAEMLNIMASNVTADSTVMFTDAMIYTYRTYIEGSAGFASFWSSQEKSAQSYLDNFIDALDEYLED